MHSPMRKLLGLAALVFVVFFVVTQPQSAATITRQGVSAVGDGFQAFVTFVTTLFA
jgi:hypothetical protein